MRKFVLPIIILVLCLGNWIISMYLFWNMAIFCDEHGSSPLLVCGGTFGLYLEWARMVGSFLLCLLALLFCVKRGKAKKVESKN